MALGRIVLVQRYLESGRLVAPFTDKAAAPRAYYVLTSSAAANNPDVTEFVDWLFREADQQARAHKRVSTNGQAKRTEEQSQRS